MERSKYLARFLRLLPFSLGDKRRSGHVTIWAHHFCRLRGKGGKNGKWPSFAALEQPSIFPVRA